MPLKYIIETFAEISGFDPVASRDVIIKKINRASKEVYEFTDLPGSLWEVTALVQPNKIVALPQYIGWLRAMREHYSWNKIELREMAPRYNYNPWIQSWQNWRVLGISPICRSVEYAALPLNFSIVSADSVDCVINIVGSTVSSSRLAEQITIAAGETEVSPANLYTNILSITKEDVNNRDITVTGRNEANTEDITLASIPNDELASAYTIVDVSAIPGGGENGGPYRYVDVLYKKRLPYLSNDADCFPCEGFDDAIVYKAMEHEAENKENGMDIALAWYQKCVQVINQRTEHTNGATQKMMTMGPNGYLGLYPRNYYRTMRRYI